MISCVLTPCFLVDAYEYFRGTHCLNFHFYLQDGRSLSFRNIYNHPKDGAKLYTSTISGSVVSSPALYSLDPRFKSWHGGRLSYLSFSVVSFSPSRNILR
jgi:hypothetical protein